MNICTLLSTIYTPSFFNEPRLICFKGSRYPLLFFTRLMTQLQSIGYLIERRDISDGNLADLTAQLQMSFLGSSHIFWFKDCSSITSKDYKQLCTYLQNYRGPHSIILFIAKDTALTFDQYQVVEIPDYVDKKLFIQLADKEYPAFTQKYKAVITAFFNEVESLEFERTYMMMRYMTLLGSAAASSLHEWLGAVVRTDTSLFTLSQYFFAKQSRSFFATWATIKDEYADAFWISFWSEQLWRAYYYSKYMQTQHMSQAKSIAFRLPFSFIQRDWKKVSLVALQQAHAQLYTLDYALKNGGNMTGLEVMYSKFFVDNYNNRGNS